MVPIRANQLEGLEWRQPSAFSRSYELKSGDTLLAGLEFLKALGTLARARTAGGVWTFKRGGFLSPVVTARVEGNEVELARYEPNWMGSRGRLQLAGGAAMELKAANFWASEWVLSDEAEGELLRFHNRGLVHAGAQVAVSAAGARREDLGLLICLMWYVLVLHMQDSSVVAAT